MSEKNVKDSNDDSSSKGKKREEKENGSSTLSKTKHCKDICPRSMSDKEAS